ncbi:putative serine/threonine-protein kinase-like protein CCR3 isoform X2 [Oryza glaberrima]|nr:putative serine/threonine-protein kinase-like protein CCR3 isoform X2 [Oryza glaberrima]
MLQDPEMMCREEIVNALSGLEGTLKEAYVLVTSCRDCSAMYRFFMGWKQADQFRRIKKKIGKHLRFYPMISHADLTRRLEKLANSAALSTCSSQDAQEVPASSSVNHSNPEARAEEVNDEFEKSDVVTQSINDVERHEAGHQDAVQTLSVRKSRSWWHDVISSKKAADAVKAHVVPRAIELFSLAELAKATMDFTLDREIGKGIFSSVYRGVLPDGREVAIERKKVDSSAGGMEAFRAEVTIQSLLHHKHIIRLVGCCVMEEEEHWSLFQKKNMVEKRLLVFEYMENGSLFDHLHGPSTSSFSPVTASWKTRIEILLGVSRAIEYLHSYATPAVIHCDIKSSNILLDSSWSPRLSGFDIAVSCDEAECVDICVRGTLGYLDPEFVRTRTLKPASDVYNFGVVMLEVLSGRRAICRWKEDHGDGDGDSPMDSLVNHALPLIDAGQVLHLLDRRPAEEPTPRQLEAADLVARTAAHCLQENGDDRPAMSDVVTRLQAALELVRCDDE